LSLPVSVWPPSAEAYGAKAGFQETSMFAEIFLLRLQFEAAARTVNETAPIAKSRFVPFYPGVFTWRPARGKHA
jgi:hypothetical protein